MRAYVTIVYLLLVARQGYWETKEKIVFSSFVRYLLPSFVTSLGLFVTYLSMGTELLTFLRLNHFLGVMTYDQLLQFILYVLAPIGIILENAAVFRAKTAESFRLFFNTSSRQLFFGLLIKNFIVFLPFLVASLFFNWFVLILLFILVHFTSLLFLNRSVSLTLPSLNLSPNLAYLLSKVDILSLLRIHMVPIISTAIFMVVYTYYPSFLGLNFTTAKSSLISGLFLGSTFYTSKGVVYFFLAVNHDLPYLKVMGLDPKIFLRRYILPALLFGFVIPCIPFAVFCNLAGFSLTSLAQVLLSMLLLYLFFQGMQMREALFLRRFHFHSVKEVESYKFSMKHRLILSSSNLVFFLMYLGLKKVPILFFPLVMLIIALFLVMSFVYHYRYSLNHLSNNGGYHDLNFSS